MKIKLLPPQVAERIAAGEVIERPSAVVKELVENSIDAQATEILVVLEDGGKGLIQVIDDGLGMSADDLVLSTARHATSKITVLDDLSRIQTLGFRGEALASINAVSRLRIVSREKGSDVATELVSPELGQAPTVESVTHGHFIGSQHGTLIEARGLFSSVPARLKFLKSPRSEVSAIKDWIERVSLSHPEIGFRLVSDDRTVLDRRKAALESRIQEFLSDGDRLELSTLTMTSDLLKATLSIFWLRGVSLPSSKKLVPIVNGRMLKDKLLFQAMQSPFQQKLLPGFFPGIVAFLEVPPDTIDVNVHPTKMEVRFLNSQEVFKFVRSSIEKLLVSEGNAGQPVQAMMSALPGTNPFLTPVQSTTTGTNPKPMVFGEALRLSDTFETPIQYLGSLFKTYLLFEDQGHFEVIDQHAAHERVKYEKLRQALEDPERIQSQELLFPVAVKSSSGHDKIASAIDACQRFGFEAEEFGEDSVVFRSVPTGFGTYGLEVRLKSLIERLTQATGETGTAFDEYLFEKVASEACRSSVMAGDTLGQDQALKLRSDLTKCKHPWSCPHGRPTTIRFSRERFEEWFQRLVHA